MKPKVDDLAYPLLEPDQTCSRTPSQSNIIPHIRTITTKLTSKECLNDHDLPVRIQDRARNRGGLVPNTSWSSRPDAKEKFRGQIWKWLNEETKGLQEITKAHTTNTSDFEKPSTITPTSFVSVIPLQTVKWYKYYY